MQMVRKLSNTAPQTVCILLWAYHLADSYEEIHTAVQKGTNGDKDVKIQNELLSLDWTIYVDCTTVVCEQHISRNVHVFICQATSQTNTPFFTEVTPHKHSISFLSW